MSTASCLSASGVQPAQPPPELGNLFFRQSLRHGKHP